MGTNTNEWIADVASFVRNSFGNTALFVTPEQVAAVRKANTRTGMWTASELAATTPMLLMNQSQWKATASHNPESAVDGITGTGTTRWTSTVPQAPGMWYQIELPRPVTIAEILVDASSSGRGGITFGGRGGTPPALGMASYRLQVSMDGTTWSADRRRTRERAESDDGMGNPARADLCDRPVMLTSLHFSVTRTCARIHG